MSAVCSLCFYHMRDLRCIHRYLDLDSAKLFWTALVSSRLNSLLYGVTDTDLTRLERVQNRLARLVTKPSPLTRSVPLLCSLHFGKVQNIVQDQFVDLQNPAWKTACLSSVHACGTTPIPFTEIKQRVLQSLRSKPTQLQELFTLLLHLFSTTSRCLSLQSVRLLHSRNIWRHISLTWLFPHRHQHAWWPVDVMELFLQFGCWTPIRLSHHWAWLHQGFGGIEIWLIDWFFRLCTT